jgi:hypothetical protein
VWLMTGLPACSDDLCGMIGLPVWHSRRTRTGERERARGAQVRPRRLWRTLYRSQPAAEYRKVHDTVENVTCFRAGASQHSARTRFVARMAECYDSLMGEGRIPRGKSPSSAPSCRSDPRRSEDCRRGERVGKNS